MSHIFVRIDEPGVESTGLFSRPIAGRSLYKNSDLLPDWPPPRYQIVLDRSHERSSGVAAPQPRIVLFLKGLAAGV